MVYAGDMLDLDFDYSRHLQEAYYLSLLKNVQMGFYQKIRAIVLPYLRKEAWYVPDFDLFSDPHFRTDVEANGKTGFFGYSPYLVQKVEKISLPLSLPEQFVEHQKQIQKHASEFLSASLKFFLLEKPIDRIVVIPVMFGTGSTYHFHEVDGKEVLYVTLRHDADYRFVFKAIVSAIIYREGGFRDESRMDWYIRKGISDFIFNHSQFKTILHFDDFVKVTAFMEGYKSDLFVESAKYFAKMGYPIKSSFAIEGENVYFNGELIVGLQNKEQLVLKALIQHRSEIVLFDDLAEIYWGDEVDEKYSLASLSKIIERIRNKLELNNIPPDSIRTIRKKGYLLYD